MFHMTYDRRREQTVDRTRQPGRGHATGDPPLPALFEPMDLCRIPLWIMARPLYSLGLVSVLFRLATLRGSVASVVSRSRTQTRRELETYLADVISRRDLRRIARRHFQFLARERLATVWPVIDDFAGVDAIEIEGRHHLDDALRGGAGAIVVSAHFGYTRLIKPILRFHGFNALLVGGQRGPGRMRPLTRVGSLVYERVLRLPRAAPHNERWTAVAGQDLPAQMNLRPHLAALQRNDILVTLADGRAGQALQRISVLGASVPLAQAVFGMARSSGAPLLPTFVIDDPHSRSPLAVRLVILPPFELQVTADARTDLTVNLKRFADLYEAQVRAQPHLWLRWSGPPPRWWKRYRDTCAFADR